MSKRTYGLLQPLKGYPMVLETGGSLSAPVPETRGLQDPPQVHPKKEDHLMACLIWDPASQLLRPQLAVSTLSCLLSLRIGHRSVTVSDHFWGTTPFPYFPTPFLQNFASSKRPRKHVLRRDRAQPFSGGNGLRLDPKWFHKFNKV